MTSRVIWLRQAKSELADLWVSAVDRKSVTDSARELEEALQYDGANAGESREGNLRILFGSTLACYYLYREFDRTSIIVKIWQRKTTTN